MFVYIYSREVFLVYFFVVVMGCWDVGLDGCGKL